MNEKNLLQEIQDNLSMVIAQDTPQGKSLWAALLELHPADIAQFISGLDQADLEDVFNLLPKNLKLAVFEDFSDIIKAHVLAFMNESDTVAALNILTADELTDLFEVLSDADLKKYLNLLHQKSREEVIALRKFPSDSAGGIMDTRVLTLMDDFTVERGTKLLQRLSPRRDIHQRLYVTDRWHRLVGYINLEDLLLQKPKTRIADFMKQNELIAHAYEDREIIAQKMRHYNETNIPVVGKDNYFLGVIPSETLVDVIIEEATEDVQKMSALPPFKHAYFETSFWRIFSERGYILMALMMAESFSNSILRAHEYTLGTLVFFLPMLMSTGGNASHQTSALVLKGIATGNLAFSNMRKFIRREFTMGVMLGSILAVGAFFRAYYTTGNVMQSLAVSLALGFIVIAAITLGSCIPFLLKRLNIDPAFAAGPVLATLLDILGVVIFCYMTKLILSGNSAPIS